MAGGIRFQRHAHRRACPPREHYTRSRIRPADDQLLHHKEPLHLQRSLHRTGRKNSSTAWTTWRSSKSFNSARHSFFFSLFIQRQACSCSNSFESQPDSMFTVTDVSTKRSASFASICDAKLWASSSEISFVKMQSIVMKRFFLATNVTIPLT